MTAPGYCKVCRSPLVKEINKKLAKGESQPSIAEWCGQRDFKVTRQKIADHKDHITDPRVTLVERAKRSPAIKASSRDLLEATVQIGHENLMANPQDVTLTQALKAAQILESTKQQKGDTRILFAMLSMGKSLPQPEMIEGTYTEIPMKETE